MLCLMLFPVCAVAYNIEVDGVCYKIHDDEAEVTNGIVYSGDVTIPSSVVYEGTVFPVTSIGDSAFYAQEDLTSISIPQSVTKVGSNAFYNCKGLSKAEYASMESLCSIKFVDICSNPLYYAHHLYVNGEEVKDVVIPDTFTSVGDYVFNGCTYLTSLTIPETITSIGRYSFRNCLGLTSLVLPQSLTDIGYSAFFYCSGLQSVDIPASVKTIGEYAFMGCRGLKEAHFASIEKMCLIKYGGFSSNPLYYAHHCYINGEELTQVTIPNSVSNIGDFAFFHCEYLKSVYMPSSVTTIGIRAFSNCIRLQSLVISDSVTTIDKHAFSECVTLQSVTLPDFVSYLGDHAFYDCEGLKTVTVPSTLLSIGEEAFDECDSLRSFWISFRTQADVPSYVERDNIFDVFYIGHLREVKHYFKISGKEQFLVAIPDSVTHIGDHAFYNFKDLWSVTIPQSVVRIGEDAFYGCENLSEVDFASIEHLCSISFGNAYSNPLHYAHNLFVNGDDVTDIVIPNKVTSLNDYAFNGCSYLTSISVEWQEPLQLSVDGLVFDGVDKQRCVLYVPTGTSSLYRSAPVWSEFEKIEEYEMLAIDDVETTAKNIVGLYDVKGHSLSTPQHGINIFLYDDGTTRKVIVK